MAKGKKTGGRQAGTLNKTTKLAKEAMATAFEGLGGVDALQTWAHKNQTDFYKLWARLIPAENNAKPALEHSGDVKRTLTDADENVLKRYHDKIIQEYIDSKSKPVE